MPEWGGLPIPKKLLQKGVRDRVRLSDGRMSGTHDGLRVAHRTRKRGGRRSLTLLVDDAELARRRAAWKPAPPPCERCFARLYREHATQAHEGCDFDFLQGAAAAPEPVIF